jgi:hypothetical protein
MLRIPLASALFVLSLFPTAPQSDVEANARAEGDFIAFDAHYKESRAQRGAHTKELAKRVYALEADGQKTSCSHQILFELVWLLTSTADFKRIDKRLDDLETSLSHPELQAKAEEQDPDDGSWGKCYSEWFLKLGASYDHLEQLSHRVERPKYPLHFLDRINSPQKLSDYLTSVSVSDIAHTGIDHDREFNAALENLLQFVVKDRAPGYSFDPKLKDTLTDLVLHRFRNPRTGWWGESYLRGDHTDYVDNLSTTFHIVSYLKGDVPDIPKVVDTLLAVKDLDYPSGWLLKGKYWNHNNMDVVTLFKLGWPNANEAQKKAMSAEIEKMLHWCVTESLQPDGSFEPNIADGSIEEGIDYGAAFLGRIGYFDKSKRFWTNQDFPEAGATRDRIAAYVRKHVDSGGSDGDNYESALEEMGLASAKKN